MLKSTSGQFYGGGWGGGPWGGPWGGGWGRGGWGAPGWRWGGGWRRGPGWRGPWGAPYGWPGGWGWYGRPYPHHMMYERGYGCCCPVVLLAMVLAGVGVLTGSATLVGRTWPRRGTAK
jgi:hypothetical protein